MKFAYNLNIGTDQQISGGPSWVGTTKFDIVAKMDDETVAALPKMPNDQKRERMQLLVRELLADRFKLKVHHETKELPVYALTVGKSGSKLTPYVDAPHAAEAGTDGKPSRSNCTGYRCRVEDRWKGMAQLPICWPMCLDFSRRLGGEW